MFIKTRTTLMVLVLSATSVGYTLAQGSPEARVPENDVTHRSATLESNTALHLTLPAARFESETTILYVDNRHLSDQHVYALTMTGRRMVLNSLEPSITLWFSSKARKKARAKGECFPLPSSTGSNPPDVITTRAFFRDILR